MPSTLTLTEDHYDRHSKSVQETKALSRVWLSRIGVDTTLTKYFDNNEHYGDIDRAAEHGRKIGRGDPVSREEYPSMIFAIYPNRTHARQPDLFNTVRGTVVSEATAEVLRQMDLGQTRLFPVTLYQHDRTTPVEGTYHFLHIAEHKRALLPAQSSGLNKPYDNKDLWTFFGTEIKDDDLMLDASALSGVDLWLDPSLRRSVFMSDRLAQALKAAKLSKRFGLRRCRTAD
jgi:hypothetical protein